MDAFAQLKAYIDHDPFGALFGYRLTGRKMYGSTDSEQAQDASQKRDTSSTTSVNKPADTNHFQQRKMPCSSGKPTEHVGLKTPKPERAQDQDGYEFDPISMRRVLKTKPTEAPSPQKPKPLFDPLFAEKAVDIPVKPYKPHKPQRDSSQPSNSECGQPARTAPPHSKAEKTMSESSRRAELRNLKTAALGNSIDTSAEYHGKWVSKSDDIQTKTATSPCAENSVDEPPLFSGTVYDPSSKDMVQGLDSPSRDWLHREGFGKKPKISNTASTATRGPAAESGVTKTSARIQPSLNRLRRRQKTPKRSSLSTDDTRAPAADVERSNPNWKYSSNPSEFRDGADEEVHLATGGVNPPMKSPGQAKQESAEGQETVYSIHQHLEQDLQSSQRDEEILRSLFSSAARESRKIFSGKLSSLLHRIGRRPKGGQADKGQAPSQEQDPISHNESEASDPKNPNEAVNVEETYPAEQNISVKSRRPSLPSQLVSSEEKESMARGVAPIRKLEKPITTVRELRTLDPQVLKSVCKVKDESITSKYRQLPVAASSDQMANQNDQGQHQAKVTRKEVEHKLEPAQDRMDRARSSRACQTGSTSQAASEDESANATVRLTTASPDPTPQHKQPAQLTSSSMNLSATNTATLPTLYKVLAYDSSTLQMTIAETTSSSPSSSSPTPGLGDAETQAHDPTEVLSRLNNVAKFLPYFVQMEKEGYEIVSGSGDVLVFKKVRPAIETRNVSSEDDKPNIPSSENMNHRSPAERVIESIVPNASSSANTTMVGNIGSTGTSKIHRQEPLFSGSVQKWHQELSSPNHNINQDPNSGSENTSASGSHRLGFISSLKTAVNRVALTASVMAGLAYGVGVAVEWL